MPGLVSPVFIPRPAAAARKPAGAGDAPAEGNPDLGPFLLKLARDAIASGESLRKGLDYALRAASELERSDGSGGVELAMSLRVAAAAYAGLGRVDEAVPVLERAIEASRTGTGSDRIWAEFSGLMQLGDAYSMMGQLEQAISCYELGLRVQIDAIGESDPRVAETYRYLAEAHMQAMQLEEAAELCKKTLEIHRRHSPPASLQEAADRRLSALVCEAKGDYETALEHLVLASMAMLAHGRDDEAASVDASIGSIYLSLCRFDEAVFAYHKALTVFKSTRGENHPSVAAVFVRLADLYHRTGKLRESKSYCESALRIYARPGPGVAEEEIASGLTEISAVYESVNEPEEALKLLRRAIALLADNPAHRGTVAGLEAQAGVVLYMVGRFSEAREAFGAAVTKLRASGERRSAFFGIVLNQMGLACVQLYKITEATGLFEEARDVLEQECGPCHLDTLGVYSNLAATYDATGRVEDAIEILDYILKVREEKLGTANPDVDDEKKRLAQLLKEVGRSRDRKGKSLENLLSSSSLRNKKEGTKRWSGFGFKI